MKTGRRRLRPTGMGLRGHEWQTAEPTGHWAQPAITQQGKMGKSKEAEWPSRWGTSGSQRHQGRQGGPHGRGAECDPRLAVLLRLGGPS